MAQSNLIKIGALWGAAMSNGERYLSGKMGDAKLIVFKNRYKEANNHPDYIVYVAPYEKKEDEPGEPPATDKTSQEDLDDPIPF